MSTGDVVALNSSRESRASTSSGYPVLLLMLAVAAVAAFLIYRGFQAHSPMLIGNTAWIGGLLILFLSCGFYMLQPNQAAAITLFGDYRGTDRSTIFDQNAGGTVSDKQRPEVSKLSDRRPERVHPS